VLRMFKRSSEVKFHDDVRSGFLVCVLRIDCQLIL